MLKEFIKKNNFNKMVFITISFSLFASFLSSLRVFVLKDVEHFFINWNILLSLISLFSALYFYYAKNENNNFLKSILIFLMFFISFLFLPNSPYMITDSIHISEKLVYRWYDSVLFFSAALSGILVYSNIIFIYFSKLKEKFSDYIIYLIITAVAFLNAFGIYLGRTYEILDKNGDRFNSWDLFTRPGVLFEKVLHIISNPFSYKEFPMLFLAFSLILIFISFVTIFISKYFVINSENK